MDKKKILVVEDEKAISDILVFNLQREGYDTLAAYDGAEGLRCALEEAPEVAGQLKGGRFGHQPLGALLIKCNFEQGIAAHRLYRRISGETESCRKPVCRPAEN